MGRTYNEGKSLANAGSVETGDAALQQMQAKGEARCVTGAAAVRQVQAHSKACVGSGQQTQAGQSLTSAFYKGQHLSQEATHPTIFRISMEGLGMLLAWRACPRMASISTLGLKEAVETLGLWSRPTKGSMTAASVVVQTTCVGRPACGQCRAACSWHTDDWLKRLRGRQGSTRSVQGCIDRRL